MTSRQTQLNRLYEAFNQHDLATVMDCLSSDITWPNTLDGGLIVGREAVGAFWRRQFEIVAIEVVPIAFAALPDGRLSVSVSRQFPIWTGCHGPTVLRPTSSALTRTEKSPVQSCPEARRRKNSFR
jgi:hypothetical protein